MPHPTNKGHRSHGQRDSGKSSPTYTSWIAMKQRCYYRGAKDYERYGGAGIQVCDRWRTSFVDFLADMGERPEGTTLDRYPDAAGNYEPGNCRWATPTQQSKNRRVARLYAYQDEHLSLREISNRTGAPYALLDRRLRAGRTIDEAVEDFQAGRFKFYRKG